jgi:hypothetical protein
MLAPREITDQIDLPAVHDHLHDDGRHRRASRPAATRSHGSRRGTCVGSTSSDDPPGELPPSPLSPPRREGGFPLAGLEGKA